MPKAASSAPDFGGPLSSGLRVCGARYLLRRLIGRGEFSELWLARNIQNARDVALKFLPKAFLQDKNLLDFFQEEVRRQTLLKHPHIVLIHELAYDYDSAAVAMEFVDGWSLATLKVDKPERRHNVTEIGPWIRELCDALTYAHNEFGMVHGDLKPSNLLVSPRDGIKVSDFGLAAHIRNESSKRGIVKSGYGGIGYLSAQQVTGETPGKADDIYSLGTTIFDLLTGTPPFYKGEVIAQICSLKPPRMAKRLADLGVQGEPIPVVWEETVAACLAKNPADRPKTAEEVLRLLERPEPKANTRDFAEPPILAAAPDQSGEKPQAAATTTPRKGSRPLTPFVAAIVAAFVAVGLIGALWFIRSGKFAAILATGHIATSPGSLDGTFKTGIGADDSIRCVALLPNGKLLIGGVFKHYDGFAESRMARLQTDGALDQTFKSQLAGTVSAIVPLGDGKTIVGGEGLLAGHGRRKVLRLNPDGSVDASFYGETYDRNIETLAAQTDGKIIVGGHFINVSGKRHRGLLRLTADGRLDDSFNVGGGSSSAVDSVAIQPDGEILAAGEFNRFNGRPVGRLVRLNPDGSFDSGFNDGTGADNTIWHVQLQKDGKILICGRFNHVNGLPCDHIARLDASGAMDTTFQASTGLGNYLGCMAQQPDGKIVVAGNATINGATQPFIVRLNAEGSLDKSFQVTGETGHGFWQIRIQPDQGILVVGRFTGLDGVLCGNLARLHE